jgi:predicted MFS family arabinose efflux permease
MPPPTIAEGQITEHHRRRALVFLFFVSLFNYGDRNMIGVLVPAIKTDLALSDTEIGFITGLAFSLLYAAMGIPIARLADTSSRKGVISVALVTWSAMTCVCGVAQNFIQLALARVMVGIGEAGATPPSHAIIADLFPKARRAFAISIYAFGSPAGMIIAYLVGAWLTQSYGWRVTLFAFGLPGIVAALLIWRYLPEPPRGHSEQVEGEPPISPARLVEALRLLLSKPAFRQNAFASSLFALVWFVLLSWVPSFFTRSHNMPIAEVGAWLALAIGAPQLIGTWLGGAWGDKFGTRDVRWYAWVCAISMVGSAPLYFIVFLSPNPLIALLALFSPS